MKKHVVQFEIEVEDDEKIKDIKNVLKTLLECLEWETSDLKLDPTPKVEFVPTPNPLDKYKEDFDKLPKPSPWKEPYISPPTSPWKPNIDPYKYPCDKPGGPKWYMEGNLSRKVEEFKAKLGSTT